MGLGSAALARMARTLALAGMDIIKDDHGLANQAFAAYADREVIVRDGKVTSVEGALR